MIDAVRIPYSLDASSSMLLQYNIASALKQVLLHMSSNDAVITCHLCSPFTIFFRRRPSNFMVVKSFI